MGPAVRVVRLIQVAMLVSIALYAVVGEKFAHTLTRGFTSNPADTLFHALSFISISIVGATVVLRRTLILPSEAVLKKKPDDNLAAARWRAGYVFIYALCEILGLFGLVLRMDGFTLVNIWGFYLGGFLLLLLYSPRVPR
jgi:Mn2+/Fe2+ NRAMP family transporter